MVIPCIRGGVHHHQSTQEKEARTWPIKLLLRKALGRVRRPGSPPRPLARHMHEHAQTPATSDPRGPRFLSYWWSLSRSRHAEGSNADPHYPCLQSIHPAFARNLHGMPPPGFLLGPPTSVPHAVRRASRPPPGQPRSPDRRAVPFRAPHGSGTAVGSRSVTVGPRSPGRPTKSIHPAAIIPQMKGFAPRCLAIHGLATDRDVLFVLRFIYYIVQYLL